MGAIPPSNSDAFRELHDRVIAALDRCDETRSIEFKESGTWESLRHKIICACLAMANLPGGGLIIIGVSEREKQWDASGVHEDHLKTFDPDNVRDAVNAIASPDVDLTMVRVDRDDKRTFLAVSVSEFDVTPVVVKKAEKKLRIGDVLVRPTRKPESQRVTHASQLHDILEHAAEKRAMRLLERSHRMGLWAPRSAWDKYEEEVNAAAREYVDFRKAATWTIRIAGDSFQDDRIPSLSEAWNVVERAQVKWWGWAFPMVLQSDDHRSHGTNWIAGFIDGGFRAQQWQFFQSGQLSAQVGIHGTGNDSRDSEQFKWAQSHRIDEAAIEAATGFVDIWEVVVRVFEAVEFARRFVRNGVFSEHIRLHIGMRGIEGTLLVASPQRMWHSTCRAGGDHLERVQDFDVEDLVANNRDIVIDTVTWIFERFGWLNPSRSIFEQDVEKLAEECR